MPLSAFFESARIVGFILIGLVVMYMIIRFIEE